MLQVGRQNKHMEIIDELDCSRISRVGAGLCCAAVTVYVGSDRMAGGSVIPEANPSLKALRDFCGKFHGQLLTQDSGTLSPLP